MLKERKKIATMQIPSFLAHLEALIVQEEQSPPVMGLTDLHTRLAARQRIEAELQTLLHGIHRTRERLQRLPNLPDLATIHWAQAMLALPNLAFLEVDTDGLGADACVLRVLLLDTQAQVLFDTCLQPARPPSDHLLALTGLTRQQLEAAPSVEQGWPLIVQAVRGHYLLSYNLAFDRDMLHRQAERSKLDLPFLVADCLMERATTYVRATTYPKLADLCTRLGYPLPLPPRQDAAARAVGQLHLLTAMAQGITGNVTPPNESEDDDEHPF